MGILFPSRTVGGRTHIKLCSRQHTIEEDDNFRVSLPHTSVVKKMAEQNSVPSDLYKHVYSFLLENKFTKAAQQFIKQAKVVGPIFCITSLFNSCFVYLLLKLAR